MLSPYSIVEQVYNRESSFFSRFIPYIESKGLKIHDVISYYDNISFVYFFLLCKSSNGTNVYVIIQWAKFMPEETKMLRCYRYYQSAKKRFLKILPDLIGC